MSITLYRSTLFESLKMVIFDFDCTISNVSFCSKKVDLRTVQNSKLEDLIDAVPFRRFVEFLISQGIAVGIATYGKKGLILELMNRVFPQNNPFSSANVIGPIDVSLNWKECYLPPKRFNKNAMIQMLQKNIPSEQILLVDDSEENVLHAREKNYQAILAPKCAGFKKTLQTLIFDLVSRDSKLYLHPEESTQQILETFI